MALTGIGLGMTMQNLVLAVQNTVPVGELGAGSSVVSFFRTMGGAIGVSAFGAVLATKVSSYLTADVAAAHLDPAATASLQGGGIPNLHTLPADVVPLVEDAYGHAIGDIFLYAAPFALVGFAVVWFIKEVALRTKSGNERTEDKAEQADPETALAPAAH